MLRLNSTLGSGLILGLCLAGLACANRSRGVLSADIGMTIAEVKRRSSLTIKEPRFMADGSRMGVEQMVFEFRLGDSGVRFPNCRYYWLQTPARDPHINVLNIGITPRKMPKAELDAFEYVAQERLFADGWIPGHYLAESAETIRMWSGARTAGDGRYWKKGGTLLIFERARMDEENRGEPDGSGEFIVDIHLRPKDFDPKLVFEPSAWQKK